MSDDTTDRTTDRVIIERTLDAAPELVWRMWTDPEHFAAWYGPPGARIPIAEMDVRVGGRRLVGMEMDTPNGPMRMWFTGEFRTVEAPTVLVYSDLLADEAGQALPASALPAGHPSETEVRVQLQDADGATRMVMTHAGVAADSPGAAGWQMAFDSLEAELASRT